MKKTVADERFPNRSQTSHVGRSAPSDSPWVSPGIAHPGFDQIYWVPTSAQAEEMSKATGRLLFAVGYCADWGGY